MNKEKLILLGILSLFLISFVHAGVPFSQGFYGTVKDTNGNNVNGEISTKINDVDSGMTDIIDGNYALVVQSSVNFGTIYFYLNGNLIETRIFNPFEVTRLNFLLNISVPFINNTSQISLTSSQKSYFTTKIDWAQFCEPNWQCSGWNSCVSNSMTRDCYDTNHCAVSYNRPIEESSCGNLISPSLVQKGDDIILFSLIVAFLVLISIMILGLTVIIIKKRNRRFIKVKRFLN